MSDQTDNRAEATLIEWHSRAQRLFRNDQVPRAIYHYTSAAGLLGIITSGTLFYRMR
jgi:hypothetical protein